MNITIAQNEVKLTFGGKEVFITSSMQFDTVNYDFAVFMSLLYHIIRHENIIMDYPITSDCRYHVELIQSYLQKYLRYKPIQLECPVENPKVPRNYKRIMPFSGGVDAVFTLLFNQYLGHPFDAVWMGHGHDIPIGNKKLYSLALEKTRRMLSICNPQIIEIQTNYRALHGSIVDWRLQNDIILSSILHLFDTQFDQAFISGGGDGGDLTIQECFLTPFFNERLFYLFSNNYMTIEGYEGGYHNRIQKIGFISQFPEVRKNLRVCLSKKHVTTDSENCGKCPKCIITQLGFLASLGEIPACFPIKAKIDDVERLIHSAFRCNDFSANPDTSRNLILKRVRQAISHAEQTGIKSKPITFAQNLLRLHNTKVSMI